MKEEKVGIGEVKSIKKHIEKSSDVIFAEEYKKLCDKHKFIIAGFPKFVSTNHGSYEIGIELKVMKVK